MTTPRLVLVIARDELGRGIALLAVAASSSSTAAARVPTSNPPPDPLSLRPVRATEGRDTPS